MHEVPRIYLVASLGVLMATAMTVSPPGGGGSAIAQTNPPPEPDVPGRESVVDNFALFDGLWQSEQFDADWALTSALNFRALFTGFAATAPDGISVDEVSCRTSWCRIKVSYDSKEAHERYAALLMSKWLATRAPCDFHYPGNAILEERAGRWEHFIFIRCLR